MAGVCRPGFFRSSAADQPEFFKPLSEVQAV
jgi:hypothetical protein